jgi:PAS domain S-box-containing protein
MVAPTPEATGALPHGYCLLWQPGLIWLHAVSDTLIGAAYVTIPLSLTHFIRQRRDIPFNWMVWCFVVFILACGATHVLGVYNIWVPAWWAAGWVKALTAAASVPTAILLYRLIPQLVALPSPQQLQRMNDKLAIEIAVRQRAEAALREKHAELEQRVEERTRELAAANASLRLLESAVQQASDAFTVTTAELDPPGPKIVYANPAFSRITGYRLDEILGRNPRFLQGPGTDRTVLDHLRQSLEAGESFAGETVNYRKDGAQFWMNWRVTPVRDDDGQISHFV